MILRHAEVRAAAAAWDRFSSDAPFRVPIPSEEDVRNARQLPIETDPPDHTDYRRITEPFFQRPKTPAMIAAVERLIVESLDAALAAGEVEVVRAFALPLQSRALALLLNVPAAEAEEWIGWGTHVFRDGADGEAKGAVLDRYIRRRLAEAEQGPGGDDFFSSITRATFRGRPLTREEQVGFTNLVFAGGRDTIIQTVAILFSLLAEQPRLLAQLRAGADIALAAEEILRVATPLTHIGRVCPRPTEVGGQTVPEGGRVSLCWASANQDETVFRDPQTVRLDRRPNPHLAFGSGPHTCQGAPHARLLVRSLLRRIADTVESIAFLEAAPHLERQPSYERAAGWERLRVALRPRSPLLQDQA